MNILSPAWSLHPQLERDTTPIGDLPLSRVLIINDANYPWLVLVPRREPGENPGNGAAKESVAAPSGD